jgi:hypothetical protein
MIANQFRRLALSLLYGSVAYSSHQQAQALPNCAKLATFQIAIAFLWRFPFSLLASLDT